ncbi:uncharacterized protein N7482_007145 [Penicillium canariense]|uniref:Bacteriophage T5 Orf172 DNA-binding domain-containing protein n=1 Tax=Penicillium canariense TaxID=189055 RepID=A0A9W9LKB4_9EURO|nr:uncharacterized protein N7482_007145 [Penicillium canariense]KAJ5160141.1 hypothetical protein N7482_007145 [Penicillium canariense]
MLSPAPCLQSQPKGLRSLESEHETDCQTENFVVSPRLIANVISGNENDLSVTCRITTITPDATTILKSLSKSGSEADPEEENTSTIKLENAAHLPISGRTRRAKTCKLQLRTSFSDPETKLSSVLSKRTKNKVALLGNGSEFHDREYWEIKSPEELGLLSALFGSKGTKRSRHTRIELWIPGNVGDIDLDFSGPKSMMFRTKLGSYNLACQKSQKQRSDINPVPPNSTGMVQGGDSKVITSCNRTPFNPSEKAFVSLGTLGIPSSTSTKYKNEVECVQKPLYKIMPLEIIQHLREDSSLCPAWTAKGTRCRIRHSTGPSVPSIANLASVEISGLFSQIQRLIHVALCSTHRRVALRDLEGWKPDFEKLSKVQGPQDSLSPHDWRLLAITSWICFVSKEAASQKDKSPSPLPRIKPDLESNPIQINPIQINPIQINLIQINPIQINPIQEFKPYITTPLAGGLAKSIAKLLTKPLLPSEINQEGFLYIFWQKGNFGHLKIGRSADVVRRLKEWANQCKKEIGAHFPDLNGGEGHEDWQKVPHICRVEALVHMELLEQRRIEKKCPGCSRSHKEYFKITPENAIQVVRKWISWMRSLPYEKRTIGGKEQWVLKREESKRLADLCQPLQLTSTPRSLPDKERIASLRPRLSLPSTVRNEGRRRGRKTI